VLQQQHGVLQDLQLLHSGDDQKQGKMPRYGKAGRGARAAPSAPTLVAALFQRKFLFCLTSAPQRKCIT
jgi:hypothetical protein